VPERRHRPCSSAQHCTVPPLPQLVTAPSPFAPSPSSRFPRRQTLRCPPRCCRV
jgi:hypothetical protein